MTKSLLLAGALLALAAGGPVRADDDDCDAPMSRWQSREAVRSMAEAQGWNVRRIKIDDGCYEIKGYDTSGREIDVKIDPATLAVIEMEYEDDDEGERSGSYNNGNGTNTGPVTPVIPPENGLFTPGSQPTVIVK